MVKVTFKNRYTGKLVKVYFDSVSSACSYVQKTVTLGCVEGFVKIEELEEVIEK